MRNNDRRLRSRHTTASQENRAAWLFLLPSLIGVLLFVLLPFVETIRRSMFDTMGSTWVGFSNYDSVLQNDAFQLAVANTARFLGICLPLLLSGSLILALVLHSRPLRETKAARVFKTTFLLPIAIPVASIVLLWQTLFSRQGLCNQSTNSCMFWRVKWLQFTRCLGISFVPSKNVKSRFRASS